MRNQALVAAAGLLVAPVQAQLFVDHFDYAEGSNLGGQGDWIAQSGNGTIESGNLTIAGLTPSSGNRFTWGNASMSMRQPIGPVDSGSLYFSLAVRVDNYGTATGTGTIAGFAVGTTTTFVTKVNIRPAEGGFNLGTSKQAGVTFGGWDPRTFTVGETIFIVGKYTFNIESGTDDTIAMWFNPDPSTFGDLTEPAPDILAGEGANDVAALDRFFFRSGGPTTQPAKTVADELRVGTTWAEVTPVPEPAEYSLMAGIGLAGFAFYRRYSQARA